MSRYLPFQLFLRQALLYPLTSPFLPPENKVELGYSYAAGQKTGTLPAGPSYGIPKTNQTTVYRAGDDGTYQKGKPDAPPRFTDNGDGTVTDNATGLMWVKDPSQLGGNFGTPAVPSAMNWNTAIDDCEALSYAGHNDWRLPNIFELISIITWQKNYLAIDESFFENIQGSPYWSSTTWKAGDTDKWYVDFAYGQVGKWFNGIGSFAIPVRDA